jgi:hypothetical protein
MRSVVVLSVIMLCVVMLSVVMLSVVMLSVIMLRVVMLSVVMLIVVMLSVVMLSVVEPTPGATLHRRLAVKGGNMAKYIAFRRNFSWNQSQQKTDVILVTLNCLPDIECSGLHYKHITSVKMIVKSDATA